MERLFIAKSAVNFHKWAIFRGFVNLPNGTKMDCSNPEKMQN
jgi:hypothetical protein